MRQFLESTGRVLRLTDKPDRDEIWHLIKICFLGVSIIGAIGFVIRILFFFVGLLPHP